MEISKLLKDNEIKLKKDLEDLETKLFNKKDNFYNFILNYFLDDDDYFIFRHNKNEKSVGKTIHFKYFDLIDFFNFLKNEHIIFVEFANDLIKLFNLKFLLYLKELKIETSLEIFAKFERDYVSIINTINNPYIVIVMLDNLNLNILNGLPKRFKNKQVDKDTPINSGYIYLVKYILSYLIHKGLNIRFIESVKNINFNNFKNYLIYLLNSNIDLDTMNNFLKTYYLLNNNFLKSYLNNIKEKPIHQKILYNNIDYYKKLFFKNNDLNYFESIDVFIKIYALKNLQNFILNGDSLVSNYILNENFKKNDNHFIVSNLELKRNLDNIESELKILSEVIKKIISIYSNDKIINETKLTTNYLFSIFFKKNINNLEKTFKIFKESKKNDDIISNEEFDILTKENLSIFYNDFIDIIKN